MLEIDIKKIIHTAVHFLPGIQAIYLFGSHAHSKARADSDVDIAFFGTDKYTQEESIHLCLLLSSQLNKDFDCIDLKNTNTAFATHIIDSGILIYGPDKNKITSFEMTLLSMYAHLSEERKDIIDDIIKRGSIYER